MAEFDVIRQLAEGKTVALLRESASVVPLSAGTFHLLQGVVRSEAHLGDFDFVVRGDRIDDIRSLTPDNSLWFLYDRSAHYGALTHRYERRADDEQRPVLRSPDFDVYFIRNRGAEGGDELLYLRRDCPAAVNLRLWPRFFLHVYPVDANDLRANMRRRGFENRDFDSRQFWRWNGKCYAVRSLPDYGVASIHTGQFTWLRTDAGGRFEQIWAGSFSPASP